MVDIMTTNSSNNSPEIVKTVDNTSASAKATAAVGPAPEPKEATPVAAEPAAVTARTFAPDALEAGVRAALGQPSAADQDRMRLDRASEGARVRRSHQRKEGERDRPADLGGARLKLGVNGSIAGSHLYWENDEDGAIEQLLYAGFEFVAPEEVNMTSAFVSDADLGHRISRFVGKKSDGSALRAYLLKCSDEIWAEREEARYAQANVWDTAIKAGKIMHDDGRYIPKGTAINLDTQFRKAY